MDDQGIGVDVSSLLHNVQTGCKAHSVAYPIGNKAISPRKADRTLSFGV
jgi:hypothetical protein